MATLKDVIKAVNLLVKNDELTAIEKDTPDTEWKAITDDGLTAITGGLGSLLSVESAKNNQDIKEHFRNEFKQVHKKSFLGAIDETLLNNSDQLFGSELAEQIKSIEDTNERVKKFIELAGGLKKLKPGNEDFEKTIQAQKDQIKTIQEANLKSLESKDAKIADLKNGHNNALVKGEFNRLANGYELAEAYKDDRIRKIVINDIFTEIQAGATLKLHPELGSISLYAKDDANIELYDGSKRVEIKDKLDAAMSPYLAKKKENEKTPPFSAETPQAGQVKLSAMAQDMRTQREDLVR